MQNNDIDPIEALATKVRFCIDNNQGKDLLNCLQAADNYLSDRKELLYDAYFAAGEFELKELDYDNSIQYFNKARKYNPTIVIVFDKIIESVLAFYSVHKTKFIKGDLSKLLPPIKMLINYYGILPASEHSLKIAEDLISRIEYRKNFVASETEEGQMTFRVNVIVDALEKEVPMEQVKKEVAKLVSDLIKKKIKKNNDNKSK